MNSFERFNERNKKRAQSTDRGNSTFIFKGYNSTLIKSGTADNFVSKEMGLSVFCFMGKPPIVDDG